jgi:hypothetical protein
MKHAHPGRARKLDETNYEIATFPTILNSGLRSLSCLFGLGQRAESKP